jgi:hypothetical protein
MQPVASPRSRPATALSRAHSALHPPRAPAPQSKAQKLLRLWRQQQLLERPALDQLQAALGTEVEATSSLRRSSRVQAASGSLSNADRASAQVRARPRHGAAA